MPTEPPREHESTYFVQDRDSLEEMTRIEVQDTMLTTGMGGVLPELADPGSLRQVLDVGCGTGGWLLETARTYPSIKKLFGGDVSSKILSYARTQAERLGLDGRVQFKEMDALQVLEFPDASFDLVNQRFASSWIHTWEWNKLLMEYIRVTRPDGIIRITEPHVLIESNSPARQKLNDILLEAFYHSGLLFASRSDGVTCELVPLLTQHGLENIQTRTHTLVFRAGEPSIQPFSENVRHAFRVLLPFLQKWAHVPSDYEEIYQQALKEMQEPGFLATWTMLTVWGTRST